MKVGESGKEEEGERGRWEEGVRTPLTRSSIPIHSARHLKSIASARACSSGLISAAGFGARTVFTEAGVSAIVDVLSSLYNLSIHAQYTIFGEEENGEGGGMTYDVLVFVVGGVAQFVYDFDYDSDEVSFVEREGAEDV